MEQGVCRAVPDPLSPIWTTCLKMDRPQPGLPGGWASVTAVQTNLSGFEPTRTVRQEDTDSHTAAL